MRFAGRSSQIGILPADGEGLIGTSWRDWYLVAVLSVGVLLSFTDRLILSFVVTDIRDELHLTDLDLSLLQGLGFACVYALAGLPMGRLADRSNRRNLIASGVVIWSAATMGCGLVQSFPQFFLLRMLVGIGEAILIPSAASMIADTFPTRTRGRALGVFAIGAVLGSGVALTLGAHLLALIQSGLLSGIASIQNFAPWRGLLFVAGLLGIALLPIFLTIREPTRLQTAAFPSLARVWRRIATDRWRVGRTCLAMGVVAAGDYGLLSWLPSVLQRQERMGVGEIGDIVGGVVGVGGVIACVLSGWISDTMARLGGAEGRRRVMLAAYCISVGGGLCFFFHGAAWALTGLALWILGSVAGSVVGSVILQESVPNEMRATTTALAGMGSALIGLGLGPTLVVVAGSLLTDGEASLRLGIAAVCSIAAFSGLALLWGRAAPRTDPEAISRQSFE